MRPTLRGVDGAMSLIRHGQKPSGRAMQMPIWDREERLFGIAFSEPDGPRIPRSGCSIRPVRCASSGTIFLESRRARARSAPARYARHALA
jgi:hypothetical protein